MHLKKVTNSTAGFKRTKAEMAEYVMGYTHDSKRAWIRQEDYDMQGGEETIDMHRMEGVQERQEAQPGRVHKAGGHQGDLEVNILGETRIATKNGIPQRLAVLIGECMIERRRRMESRAHAKRKRR